jgi:Gamma-glutamyltranspeptidase
MVVSNHPLASSAGAEMLAAGGNAIDAAIATLFALTVVEPMMVGIIGGGMAHIRLADGSHRFIDGQSTVPLAVRPDTYTSKPDAAHDVFDTVGDENLSGPKAVAVLRQRLSYPRMRVSSTPRPVGSITNVSGILGHPLSRMTTACAYFRTQITRTTDALASSDPPAALTPVALRKPRTVSAVTRTA